MKSYRWTKWFARMALCTALLVAFAGYACAAEVKLAKVNLEGLYADSARIKAAIEDIKKTQAEAEVKIANLKGEADKIEEKLRAEEDKLKKEDKEKLAKELEAKNQGIEQEQQTARAKVIFKQRSVQNVIGTQIRSILEKIAKEDGLTAILANSAVLYSGQIVDLTERVTKELDAMPAAENVKQ
jgi:Skp family chaperone for outer membrane proteins